ncbi:MAG TPA: hypothetical protein VIM70_12415 [Clostridium sp.]|uniref:hypothetical protein n=1 Tax=Clostridium sp. TaxID=1506 RepID=UPI002F929414
MSNTTTTNFADFGSRERAMAEDLLKASREQGFPEDFEQEEITIMMNMNSGNVFFTNSEYQVAMMNGDTLESFYSLPYGGAEGFKEDLKNELDRETLNQDDIDYMVQIGAYEEEEENEE